MMSRRSAAAGSALLLALALAGCASSVPSAVTGSRDPQQALDAVNFPEVDISEYGDVTADLDYDHAIATTPEDALGITTPEFAVRILHGIAVEADVCMEKNGFAASAASADWSPFVAEEDRTYGLWSVPYAQTYGMALASDVTSMKPLDTSGLSTEERNQLETCYDQAKTTLSDDLLWIQDRNNLQTSIGFQAYDLTLADGEAQAARSDWTTCLTDAGIEVDPDDGRPIDAYKSEGKEAEIAAAVAEAQCARTTGAVQRLYDIQARYESALIDAMAPEVREFETRRDQIIDKFDALIAKSEQ